MAAGAECANRGTREPPIGGIRGGLLDVLHHQAGHLRGVRDGAHMTGAADRH
jgi:hypothetical protein